MIRTSFNAATTEEQEEERTAAGSDWEGKRYVFASPTGGPLSPNTENLRRTTLKGPTASGGALQHRAR